VVLVLQLNPYVLLSPPDTEQQTFIGEQPQQNNANIALANSKHAPVQP